MVNDLKGRTDCAEGQFFLLISPKITESASETSIRLAISSGSASSHCRVAEQAKPRKGVLVSRCVVSLRWVSHGFHTVFSMLEVEKVAVAVKVTSTVGSGKKVVATT